MNAEPARGSVSREDVKPALPRPPLVAYVADAASEAALREGLSEILPGEFVVHRMGCAHAIAHLRRNPSPKVLIADISGEEQPINALVALADAVEPDVKVLLIGDRQDINFYRQVTRGLCASEYLYKPLARIMVERHFGPHVGSGQPVADAVVGGRVLAVMAAGGGAGGTTVAVNLAAHFATDIRRHTLLLDPDLHTGQAALALGAKSDAGLRTALEFPDRLDELFVERSAQPVTDRLSVLSSEEDLGEHVSVPPDAVDRLLEVLRRRYNFVVVDSPFRPHGIMRDCLRLAHQRVLVMTPTLAGIRDALRLMQLEKGPQQTRRALLVLNQVGRPGTLSREQVEDALETRADAAIPYLPKLVTQSLIEGRPAVLTRSPFRTAMMALGEQVASVRAPGGHPEGGDASASPFAKLAARFMPRVGR